MAKADLHNAKLAVLALFEAIALLDKVQINTYYGKKLIHDSKGKISDAIIDLHNAGVPCPKPLPRDPLAKKTNQS